MREILKYKYLIWELATRELKVKYRRPAFGFFWMLIIPCSMALVYKVLFSDFMQASTGKYPFFIYLLTAMLPWSYFTASIQDSTRCILGSKNILNQIHFPKHLLPVSVVFANLINFIPTLLVLVIFLLFFKIKISVLILFLPLVILIQTFLTIGIAFLVSALEVVYRDVEYIVQVVLMALFFLVPGVYTLDMLVSRASPVFVKIYMLNPLVGIINLYRIVLIRDYISSVPKVINLANLLLSPLFFSIAILFFGYWIFRRYENVFAEHINV